MAEEPVNLSKNVLPIRTTSRKHITKYTLHFNNVAARNEKW